MIFQSTGTLPPRGLPLRLNQVWDSIPAQLSKENKKFLYGAVRKGGRGRDFELAIQWLVDSSLALKVTRVNVPDYPLKMYEEFDAFKLYMLDVGLLRAMAGVDPAVILEGDAIFGTAKGAFAEQYVCQQLAMQGVDSYYWSAENSSAELDFVVQKGAFVVPVEVKSGVNLQAKSLKSAIKRFGFNEALRFSTLPPRCDGAIRDYPLYAVEAFGKLIP